MKQTWASRALYYQNNCNHQPQTQRKPATKSPFSGKVVRVTTVSKKNNRLLKFSGKVGTSKARLQKLKYIMIQCAKDFMCQ